MNNDAAANANSNANTNIDFWEKVLQNPSPVYAQLFKDEKEFLLAQIPKDSYVLDIGCGDGRNIENMLPATKNIVGLDNDPKAVEDAKKRLADIPSVQIVQGSAFDLFFDDETFDVVILMVALGNFEDMKATALGEMKRVMKKGGKVLMSVYSENAYDERMKMYKSLGAPIVDSDGSKVVFDGLVGSRVSEQFSKEEIAALAKEAGLTVSSWEMSGDFAYLCVLI